MNVKSLINNKVIAAGSWYTITNFFLQGISFLTIPIFTRLLSTSDYGMVSIYSTWVGIFTVLIGLNLNTSVTMRKFHVGEGYNEFISSVTFLSLLLFIFCLTMFALFKKFFLNIINLPEPLYYFMIFHAYCAFLGSLINSKFRVEYKYKTISIISIVISILGVFTSIYLISNVFTTQKYLGKIIGSGVLEIISGVFFLFFLLIKGKKLINVEYWKYAISLSTPLVLHSISGIVNAQSDRIIINKFLGESQTGIYSFAYSIGMIISVLLISFDQAWAPWFFERMALKEYKVLKLRAIQYRNTFVALYTIILLISPELVKVMANRNYWEGLYIVPWIFMAYYFNFMYTLEIKVELFHKKTSLISFGTFLSAGINLILNIIFVPKYGYVASAIATVISYFLLFVFHYILTTMVIKQKIFGLRFHLQSIIAVVLVTCLFILLQEMIVIRLFIALIAIIVLIFKTRKLLA
jgi:O-antigen/teichoic acid export membrane protein